MGRFIVNRTVAFHTLGCKVNQYETEAMIGLFEKEGYEVVAWSDRADVYVVNTCTVTNIGDRKSRQFLRQAKGNNPDALVVAVGCYAQVAGETLASIDEVDLILGTNEKSKILSYVESADRERNQVHPVVPGDGFDELFLDRLSETTRAFVKVQDGCNQYCSYCIIPYARGPIRSRALDQVIDEVHGLADQGVREFVMTGIHIASYGRDNGGPGLIDLLEAVDAVDGVERLRLSSLEPRLITRPFVERLARLKSLCPHFHLSLQSGDDEILRVMNRRYTTSEYAAAIAMIRQYFQDPAITTDVIVGFPGESEEAFERTMAFVESVGFSELHVFKYSPKEGTPAAKMKDQVPGTVKSERSKRLIELGEELRASYLEHQVGSEHILLVEESEGLGAMGYSENYLRISVPDAQASPGDLLKVRVHTVTGEELLGSLL
jgi:threonylcarbamoyladenosine tRNA methylthiotransferase MtaB